MKRGIRGPFLHTRVPQHYTGHTSPALTIYDEVPDLADYYARSVITGAGAFVMDIRRLGDFATAIRRKLTREITSGMVADIRHHVDIASAIR